MKLIAKNPIHMPKCANWLRPAVVVRSSGGGEFQS
jgi:hypothetical protein